MYLTLNVNERLSYAERAQTSTEAYSMPDLCQIVSDCRRYRPECVCVVFQQNPLRCDKLWSFSPIIGERDFWGFGDFSQTGSYPPIIPNDLFVE